MSLSELDRETRFSLRRAIGPGAIGAVSAAAELVQSSGVREPVIPLNDAVTLEDCRLEWIRDPVLRLAAATHLLTAGRLDPSDANGVRRRAARVASRATAAAEVASFLSYFRSNLLEQVVVAAYEAAVEAAAALIAALTDDAGEIATEAVGRFNEIEPRLEEDARILGLLPAASASDLELEEPSGEEHFGLLFGLRPDDFVAGYGDWAKRLRSSGIDPREVVQRQLAYLGELPCGELSDAYVNFAFRLPLSGFPLLAHRFMYLTTELATAAAGVDASAVHRLVLSFFRNEAAWIIAAGARYEKAMRAYLEDDDRPSILDAYRRLCEGIFRPYASLLCALAEAKLGTAPTTLVVEPTLGAIEQRLQRVSEDPACRLLASFVRSDLRNAEAHARAAIGGSGELIVRLADGRHEAVAPNAIWTTTQSLRSALDGVDAAINVFFATSAAYSATPDDFLPFLSERMVEEIARRAAHEHTDGTISSLRIDRGRLSATFVGEATEAQLNLMLRKLAVAAGNQFKELAAVSEDGRLLYVLTPNAP